MPATHKRITTIEQLLALPDDGMRHELLDGVHAVTPAPSLLHQRAVGRLYVALHTATQECEDVELLTSPADIVLGARDLVQPDLFVVNKAHDKARPNWPDVGVPLLAVEILSPTTAARDRGVKRRIYQRAGVTEYWIVDLDSRLVERWSPEDERPQICDSMLQWRLPNGGEGQIDLAAMFEKILET